MRSIFGFPSLSIVHMDENGNYKVVYGLKLDQIPKGDIKVMINAHGELGKIENRSIEEIAEHISIIDRATGEDSGVRKVSLLSCSLGDDYYFWFSIFINRKGNIIMLVCIRIHSDYLSFFIECVSFKGRWSDIFQNRTHLRQSTP
jgi:hypothetical protein